MVSWVPACSKGYCWMCFSAVSCQCIPPTPREAQMEGTSLLDLCWPFSKLAGGRGWGCCWTGRQRSVGRASSSVCCGALPAAGKAPSGPVVMRARSHPCSLPSQWCSACRGTAMGLHTQAGQDCSCGILSFVLYENWIYGSWVSLYFHMFLCGRTSFPLSCYITLG